MDEDERRGLQNTFYEWEPLQLAVKRESIFPSTHPFTRYLPAGWHQGDRGSCVGHACAIWMQCNYYALTNDYPAPDEIDQSARDRQLDLKTCFLVYDKWYRTVFSAQWCYHIS